MANTKAEDHVLELSFTEKEIIRIKAEITYQKIIQKLNQIVDLELVADALTKEAAITGHNINMKDYFKKKNDVNAALEVQKKDLQTAIDLFSTYKVKLSGKEPVKEKKA